MKCGNRDSPPSDDVFHKDDARKWIEELDWNIVLMGFLCGVVVGVIMGHNWTTKIQQWFVSIVKGSKEEQSTDEGLYDLHSVPKL